MRLEKLISKSDSLELEVSIIEPKKETKGIDSSLKIRIRSGARPVHKLSRQ